MIFLQHLKCKPLLRTPKVFAKNTQNTIFFTLLSDTSHNKLDSENEINYFFVTFLISILTYAQLFWP